MADSSKDKEEKQPANPSSSSIGNLSQNNPLSRKLNRILETRLEDERDTIESLKVLSEFLPANTLHARRNLRSDIERRGLLLSEEFRDLLGSLAAQIQDMQVSDNFYNILILWVWFKSRDII